jgi:hypothetical protein
MNYNVLVEGQTIPVPEDIGANDESVKRALTPFYPEVANALITRTEKDGTTTITVIKKAGSKGLTGLDYLIACPGGKNPAIALYEKFQALDAVNETDPLALLEMDAQIEEAITVGSDQSDSVVYALKRLTKSAPHCSRVVIRGF